MATFSDALLDDHEHRAARLVARALLSDAAAQRERLGGGEDPEALHDFRVAVRRLRSWIRAQSGVLDESVPKRARRRLRRVASATTVSRDSEVLAGWIEAIKTALTARQRVGAAWLLERLALERRAADARAAAKIDRDFEQVRVLLEERLPVYRLVHHVDDGVRAPSFAGGMAALVAVHGSALRRRLSAVRDLTDDELIHRARIAGKRLRYLLEPVAQHLPSGADAITDLKRLQDTLGDLHDAHVWLQILRDAIVTAGAEQATQLASSAGIEAPVKRAAVGAAARRDPRPGLLALAELVRLRATTTYDALKAEWLSDEPAALFDHIDAIVAALEVRGQSGVEIERKYLLSQLPLELPATTEKKIDQGYLPGERLIERLRRVEEGSDVSYFRTVKTGVGIARTELEEPCSREVFEAMWPLTRDRRVAKKRHLVRDGASVWEIDEFLDRDLTLAEIELRSADVVPEIPEWLAPFMVREVTGESEYVNANLAR